MTKPKTGPLEAQIAASNDQRARANTMGGSFTDLMNANIGKQDAAIGAATPGMSALMSLLTGQQLDYAGQQQDLMALLPGLMQQQGQLFDQSQRMETAANTAVQVNPMDAKQLTEGMSPEARAAATGQAIDTSARYDTAMSNLKAQMGARGFGDPTGTMGNIYAAREGERAGALRDINLQDEALRRDAIEKNRGFNLENLKNAQSFGLNSKNLTLQGLMNALTGGTGALNAGISGMNAGSNAIQTGVSNLNAGTNMYGTQGNLLNVLLAAYDPKAYGQMAGNTLSAGNQANATGMQGATTIATLPSFWNNLATAAVGAAGGWATGGFKNPFAGKSGTSGTSGGIGISGGG